MRELPNMPEHSVITLHTSFLDFYTNELCRALLQIDHKIIEDAISVLSQTRKSRGMIYCFGNGGSASIAAHFSHNLNWDVSESLPDHEKFKAMALNEQSCHLTGIGNDRHFDQVFVAQLRNLLEQKDLIFAISASGQSDSVVAAVEYAHTRGVRVITLTGCGGGRLSQLGCGLNIIVDSLDQQISEDVQSAICHILIRILYYGSVGIDISKGFPDIAQLRSKRTYLLHREKGRETCAEDA